LVFCHKDGLLGRSDAKSQLIHQSIARIPALVLNNCLKVPRILQLTRLELSLSLDLSVQDIMLQGDYTSQLYGMVCNKEVEQFLLRDECLLYILQLLLSSDSGSGLLVRINLGVLPPRSVHIPFFPQGELTLSYCLMILRLYFLLKL